VPVRAPAGHGPDLVDGRAGTAGAAVHRDGIIDMLWAERPPASAVAEVQGYVSRLRKLLGDGEVVSTSGPCYQLATGTGQLDLAAFRLLAGQACEAAIGSDPDPAVGCDRYEQALGLWRGDVLADAHLRVLQHDWSV
jgi:DNA-binding SARP family transcriptional activator